MKLRSWKDICGFTLGYIGDFYGIKGIAYISHGGWCNPELYYKGKSYNYYAVEDALWVYYREETDGADEDAFGTWVKENAALTKEILEELDRAQDYFKAPSYAFPA